MNRSAAIGLALAALASGCGNYSTEDLLFLAALPRRPDLQVAVPAGGTGTTVLASGALTSCAPPGAANVWLEAKKTSDGLNAGVDFVIGLVDAVRKHPPTARQDDARRWGPFDDDKHPGHEIQVVIVRTWPLGPGGPPTYAYRFEARVKGTEAWSQLISGTFRGPSASSGAGELLLDFVAFHTVGVANPDTPSGALHVVYDRLSDPVTLQLDLTAGTAGGFGVVSFTYGYAGYADGRGAFDFRFRNATNDQVTVAASWDAAKAGRLRADFVAASSATGYFNQCFDPGACLVYVDDPSNFTSACGTAPCTIGTTAACAAVPVPPF